MHTSIEARSELAIEPLDGPSASGRSVIAPAKRCWQLIKGQTVRSRPLGPDGRFWLPNRLSDGRLGHVLVQKRCLMSRPRGRTGCARPVSSADGPFGPGSAGRVDR